MPSYLCPISNPKSDWIAEMLTSWKDSGKRELIFFKSVCDTTKNKLELLKTVSWMYLYEMPEQNETTNPSPTNLKGSVRFRVRVIQYSSNLADLETGSSAYVYDKDDPEPEKVWFKCDLVEELRLDQPDVSQTPRCLNGNDFTHQNDLKGHQGVAEGLIEPVRLRTKDSAEKHYLDSLLFVVQTTSNYRIV